MKTQKNIYRINGWPGFLQREIWEVAGRENEGAENVFEELGWKMIWVKDKPGLVAARVISMIVNEAFFALEEKISTKEEIDMAMKLGTNYPFGPFEWAQKIGGDKIVHLLNRLNQEDKRYQPAAALLSQTL
jgi:3-hydroxybutyryl-CoA dehydrogenase